MSLLKNALGFIFLSLIAVSCSNNKNAEPNIIFKIPDPLREGIKENRIKYAKISIYNILPNGKKAKKNYFPYELYDSLGNIIEENKTAILNQHKYIYDLNGFQKVRYYDGCFTSREAIFYKQTGTNELTARVIYLKDVKWGNAIDTTNHATIITKGVTYSFYPNGDLKKTYYKYKINTTYLYDSLNRLATIVDSLERNEDDYELPVRKEFIYDNNGRLKRIARLSRSNLLSSANVNQKGLIDTICYFNKQRKLEKLEVYNYK